MQACAEHARYFYGDREAMIASITARAAFENEPIDALYNYSLYERLKEVIAEYQATGNADLIREVIDTTIARSLRSVEGIELGRRRKFFPRRGRGTTKGAKKI